MSYLFAHQIIDIFVFYEVFQQQTRQLPLSSHSPFVLPFRDNSSAVHCDLPEWHPKGNNMKFSPRYDYFWRCARAAATFFCQ